MSEESISQSQTKIEAAKQELRDSIAKRGQATSIKDFIPGLILTLLLVASVVGGCYFFSLTGITIQMFLTINEFALFNTMLGLNFIYFILLSSLSLALIMALGRKYIFKFSLIFGFVGYIIGAVVGIFLFNLLDFTFPILCLLIGIPLGTKYLAKKEEESKYMPLLRSGASAAGRIITIFAILFMLMLFFITIQTKDTLKENFVPEMLKMTIGGDGLGNN
ncbi:MAG: hypothetical protein NTY48_03415 [Candidatus Diapherotrites archaeon]|nr:hypothetical protein [Candidatus Diapherotrites archaeon]